MPLDPKPNKSVGELLEGIDNGEFVIPYFQRGFEWEPNMVRELLVSIISDYFAGLILLWQLDPEKVKNEKWDPIWGANIGKYVNYAVLDGQQRLSSLYYAIYNPEKAFPNRKSYYLFFVDLKKYFEGDFDECVFYKFYNEYIPTSKLKEQMKKWINELVFPIALLSDNGFLKNEYKDWMKEYARKLHEVLEDTTHDLLDINTELQKLENKILDYEFPVHILGKDRSLYDVCSIFARINQKGLRLSTFDLMNAFLYPKGIALRKEFENLKYETLKKIPGIDELLLKTMSLYKQDYCSSKYIYNLIPGQKAIQKVDGKKQEVILVEDRKEFEKLWQNSVKYCENARKKIMNTGEYDFGSIKVDFIPNNTTISVIGAIQWIYEEKFKDEIYGGEFNELLFKWYWNAVLSKDYSGSSDTIMSKDFRQLKAWFEEKELPERVRNTEHIKEIIRELDLKRERKGSSVYNAIISLLALKKAKDFLTGRVPGSVDYVGESVNDHHIFPSRVKGLEPNKRKSFLDTKDNIVNRTLLLDETNIKIENKRPSEYLQDILERLNNDEKELYALMESHLISEKALQHMWDDNYDDFIIERENTIKEYLARIVKVDLSKFKKQRN